MGTKWGPNGTKWGPKAEMLIFHWFYKVFGGSDWEPKAKMLIFHWFYEVFGDTKRVPRAKMLKNYCFLKAKPGYVHSRPAGLGTPGGDPLWLFKKPTRTLQWKPLLGKKLFLAMMAASTEQIKNLCKKTSQGMQLSIPKIWGNLVKPTKNALI